MDSFIARSGVYVIIKIIQMKKEKTLIENVMACKSKEIIAVSSRGYRDLVSLILASPDLHTPEKSDISNYSSFGDITYLNKIVRLDNQLIGHEIKYIKK